MKHSIDYYRDKYEHGFFHYLRRVNYIDSISGTLNECAEAAVEAGQGLFGLLINVPLLVLRATVFWPLARVFEYKDNKKELAELIKRDCARADGGEGKAT